MVLEPRVRRGITPPMPSTVPCRHSAPPATWSVAALVFAVLVSATAGETVPPVDTQQRTQWNGSQVRGAPEPPAHWRTVPAFPKLKFDSPVDLRMPADGKRWYVLELAGIVRTFLPDGAAAKADQLLDISTPSLPWQVRRQVYGMVHHPKFAENGQLFLCYREQRPGPPRMRISRFQVENRAGNGAPTCSADSEVIICDWLCYEDHFGGSIHFGRDGMLYFSAGDGSGYGDARESGQDLSDFNASVMRIDVDRTVAGRNYSIPADNPFVQTPGARGEVWAYGMRNIWKMGFDRGTGELWGCDVGQDLWESVIRIERGANYGWSVKEGSHDFRPERKHGVVPITPPLYEHEHSEARSITGGYVYRGTRHQELVGAYLYGDYDTGKIWGLRAQGAKVTWHEELVDTALRIVAFAEDAAGEQIILDHTGTLHRLEPQDPAVLAAAKAHRFPRKLSETGLYASTADNRVAAGVIPYSVTSPLWSDGSFKERYVALPGDSRISLDGSWTGWNFPNGTVLVKTFALDLVAGDPTSRKRLETRILHNEQDHWRGYTYLWNDAQTDADLLEGQAGLDRTYTVRDAKAPGGKRDQVWHFPGRAECTLCHTMPANFTLGFNAPQLDRSHDYGGGVVANQIEVFNRLGLFNKPLTKPFAMPAVLGISEEHKDRTIRLVDPHDTSAPLDQRARSYLHANCAHCHMKWGGGNAYFFLPAHLPLAETNAVNAAPQHGDLGIAGSKVLVPGDPAHSLILTRMSLLGPNRMPRVGSNVVDADAVKLISEWIASLPKQ